jgi:hypothetical protein
MQHLQQLVEHEVYEVLELPQGVRPLSIRWVEKDDYQTAKARLTVRGFEQALSGDEQFYSATPNAATLRMLLVVAQALGLSVVVGDCAQAFLQAPLQEKEDVWVRPPVEACCPPGYGWKLKKTMPGLKGGPAAWGAHATKTKLELYNLTPSVHDPCVHSNPKEKVWALRHMDDYLCVGPYEKVKNLTDDMGHTLLLRDVLFLEVGQPPVKFLGWMLQRVAEGFRLGVNPQLIDDIVSDAGVASSSRQCATAGTKERVIDATPLDAEEHTYFRTQVGRLLFLSALRPDLQYAVGQLARQAAHPRVADRIALKRCVRFLHCTRDATLDLYPKGRLAVVAVADADWAGILERRSVSGGVLQLSGCCVLSWSRTQSAYALSSCEAELYAMGSAAAEALGAQAFLVEQNLVREPPVVAGDSSSALQLAGRRGQGRLKHVEVRLLALQQWCQEGRLRLRKVASADNEADLMTKHVPRATWKWLAGRIGLSVL